MGMSAPLPPHALTRVLPRSSSFFLLAPYAEAVPSSLPGTPLSPCSLNLRPNLRSLRVEPKRKAQVQVFYLGSGEIQTETPGSE